MRGLRNSIRRWTSSPAVIETLEGRLLRSVNPAGVLSEHVSTQIDLTVERVQAPSKPILVEENIVVGRTATVAIDNRGTESARGTISISFYLSPDSTLDGAAFLAGKPAVRSIDLKPGISKKFSELLVPPVTTVAGDYFLFAVLTPKSGIVQTNAGDEVGEAAGKVNVALHARRPTPQPPAAEILNDETEVNGAPGCAGDSVSCPQGDSSDSSPTPSTCPTTIPATEPANTDDSATDNSQTDAGNNPNPNVPVQDSPCNSGASDGGGDQNAPPDNSGADDSGDGDSSGSDTSSSDDSSD